MFRIVTGTLIVGIGLPFLVAGIFAQPVFLIHGTAITAVGIAILLNKKEDEIEKIKQNKYDK